MFNLPVRKCNDNWYPFSDIGDIQKEMNRLFEFSFPSFGQSDAALVAGSWVPAVDVEDTKDNIIVKADLPGFKKENIDVSVENDVLTIKGERKTGKDVKKENFLRTERCYGRFQRSFALPAPVDSTKLNASFKDGVLELTLGKREDAKTKQINIDIE